MVSDKYKDWSPCIYQGNIDCADCPNKHDGFDACDMRAGRDLHREAFEAGRASSDATIKELVEALEDYVSLDLSSPSCQDGVIEKCHCRVCVRYRSKQLIAKHGQGG